MIAFGDNRLEEAEMTFDVLQTLVDYHYWARDRLLPPSRRSPTSS